MDAGLNIEPTPRARSGKESTTTNPLTALFTVSPLFVAFCVELRWPVADSCSCRQMAIQLYRALLPNSGCVPSSATKSVPAAPGAVSANLYRQLGDADLLMCCSDYPHSEGTATPLDDYAAPGTFGLTPTTRRGCSTITWRSCFGRAVWLSRPRIRIGSSWEGPENRPREW